MHTGESWKERAKQKFRERGRGGQRKMDVRKEREEEKVRRRK